MNTIENLNSRFGIEGKLSIKQNESGFKYVDINTGVSTAKILIYGAHAISFVPQGEEELLWVSPKTEYQEGKAVRGGIPVCFPWFGPSPVDANLPKHGFGRLMEWELKSTTVNSDDTIEVVMTLQATDESFYFWPHEFKATMTFTVGNSLKATLNVTNTGVAEMQYSAALHTYFNVGDANSVSVDGLSGHYYYPNGSTERLMQKEPYYTLEGFVDRCYVNHSHTCYIQDAALNRTIEAAKEGSNCTVVWNPWEEGARLIIDMPDDGYLGFVCVEAANCFDDTIVLQPGDDHSTSVILRVKE